MLYSRVGLSFVQPVCRLVAKGYRLSGSMFERFSLPEFKECGVNVVVRAPRHLTNAQEISLGEDVYIGPNSTLVSVKSFDGFSGRQNFSPNLRIGSRFWATWGLQIYCAQSVVIEDDVMMAGNVFICDYQHGYKRADVAYKFQPFDPIGPIKVGRGSWLGQNVVVMPGVQIGEYSIIGASSVVTRSVPARCIAVGSPARVIKIWSEQAQAWVGPQNDGCHS